MNISSTYASLLHLLILALCPVVILVHHAAFARLNSRFSGKYSNQAICLLSILAASVSEAVLLIFFGLPGRTGAPFFPTLLYSVLLYLALGYTYFHLFNMSETARRIRLLYDIDSGTSFSIGINTASDASVAAKSLTTRLNRLVALGQVEVRGGTYVTSGRILLFGARFVRLWGVLLRMDLLKD